MNDLETSIRDALHTDADRAPTSAVDWICPSVATASPGHPTARAMMLVAAAVLVVGGLWVVVRRDTGANQPSASTAAGGLDFSGVHRAAMEALFPPDPDASLFESTLTGSNSGAYELQVAIENAPALALYGRAGFVDHHRYRYRLPAPALTSPEQRAGG